LSWGTGETPFLGLKIAGAQSGITLGPEWGEPEAEFGYPGMKEELKSAPSSPQRSPVDTAFTGEPGE
jgi:hypothetical protein